MTIRDLDHVWYWTADMDRAVAFYVDVLGLELLRREGDTWAAFRAGPIHLALHGLVEGRQAEPGGGGVVFEVNDLDSARAALEGKGVEFAEHIGEVSGYARFASFEDPDGNPLQIIEYLGRT